MEDVFALGDCAGFVEGTGKEVLPALAQVRHILTQHQLIFTCIESSSQF